MKEIGRGTKLAYCALLALFVLLGAEFAYQALPPTSEWSECNIGSQCWYNETWLEIAFNLIVGVSTLVALSAVCFLLVRRGDRTWRRLGYAGLACVGALIVEVYFLLPPEFWM